MFTKAFWKGVTERAIKAFSYSLVAAMTADGFNVLDLEGVKGALVVAGTAALLSVLGSIASDILPIGPEGSPSLVHDRAEDGD